MPITLTPQAIAYYQTLLAQQSGAAFVRFSIRQDGCAGWQYEVTLLEVPFPGDLLILKEPITCYLCPKSAPHLIGTVVDYQKKGALDQGDILFKNPQATSHCGCNKSFSVNTNNDKSE
jgi:iron-sulfur cluster assembly accessory protein